MKIDLGANLRIGLSTSVLNRAYGSDKSLDGIGVYTQSLLSEYQNAGLSPQGYAFPPVQKSCSYKEYPASFRTMVLKGAFPCTKPFEVSVDIFHVTDYLAVPMTCPVVTTLYDAIPFVEPGMANGRLRSLKNYILKRSASYADHVIAISNFSVEELVEHYGIPERKISVVYCGVDQSWLDLPDDADVDQVLRVRQLERGYFLTVGTLQPRKNLERMLMAHSQLSTAEKLARPLVVVGRAGWNCQDLVKKLQKKIELGEAHWFSDVQTRAELKCLYAGASVFLFPSLYEGFGLPVLEAFAMGVPVITSNTTSLPEVSKGIAVEIDPTDLSEMSGAMEFLPRDPAIDQRIADGKERAAELTWARCARETLSVYQNLVSGRI